MNSYHENTVLCSVTSLIFLQFGKFPSSVCMLTILAAPHFGGKLDCAPGTVKAIV